MKNQAGNGKPADSFSDDHISLEGIDIRTLCSKIVDNGADWETGKPSESLLSKIEDPWFQGVSCGQGWFPLIHAIDKLLTDALGTYNIYQIKEKFGTLRYYWEPSPQKSRQVPDEFMNELVLFVHRGEALSAVLCETCGQPGETRNLPSSPIIKTVCDSCYATYSGS